MKAILNMININNIKQEDVATFKELYPEYYKVLVQVILNRTENQIKSKKKILIKTQNELSDLKKIAIDLDASIQDVPKNNFNTSMPKQLYDSWYKSNINSLCECQKRKLRLRKSYPLVQRDCCYGQEIGAY